MPYTVTLSPHAQRQLRALDRPIRDRLLPPIRALADDPPPRGSIKLTGAEETYRIRVGMYRIVYDVHDQDQTVIINKVPHACGPMLCRGCVSPVLGSHGYCCSIHHRYFGTGKERVKVERNSGFLWLKTSR